MSRNPDSVVQRAIDEALQDAPKLTDEVGRRLGALLFGLEQ